MIFAHVLQGRSTREFKRYCLDRARRMRDTIKYQLGLLDIEYAGKDLPVFTVIEVEE